MSTAAIMHVSYNLSVSLKCPIDLGSPAIDRLELYIGDGPNIQSAADVLRKQGGDTEVPNPSLQLLYKTAPNTLIPNQVIRMDAPFTRAFTSRSAVVILAVQPITSTVSKYYVWHLKYYDSKSALDGVVEYQPPMGATPSTIPPPYAWYTPASWSNNQWADTSGNNRHSVETRGTIQVGDSTDPSGRTVRSLIGNTAAGLRFPTSVLPPTYTIVHLTRYTGGSRGRIVSGIGWNWLSGHWSGRSGIAHHNEWLTPYDNVFGDNWVLSSSQNGRYRANGAERNAGTRTGASTRLTVNYGDYNEWSDWACAEVLVYDRHLSPAEIVQVETHIATKHNVRSLLPS